MGRTFGGDIFFRFGFRHVRVDLLGTSSPGQVTLQVFPPSHTTVVVRSNLYNVLILPHIFKVFLSIQEIGPTFLLVGFHRFFIGLIQVSDFTFGTFPGVLHVRVHVLPEQDVVRSSPSS